MPKTKLFIAVVDADYDIRAYAAKTENGAIERVAREYVATHSHDYDVLEALAEEDWDEAVELYFQDSDNESCSLILDEVELI